MSQNTPPTHGLQIGDEPTQSEPDNAFSRLLQEFREGESLSELSDNLRKLVRAVHQTDKPGKLIYTVAVEPNGNAYLVTDDIKLKLPESKRVASVFFATEEATLQRQDPNQRNLDLREVRRPEVPIKDLSAGIKAANQAAGIQPEQGQASA